MRGFDPWRAWFLGRQQDGGRVDRHLPYFAVLDALREAGCPICRLVIRGSERFLDGLLYESVTDPYVRARIREGQGFCNWHAWMLPKISSAAAGIATIHEDVLAQEIKAVRHAEERRRGPTWRERVRGWVHGGRRGRDAQCAACAIIAESTELTALSVLVVSMPEPEFRQAFLDSFGLCLPHFRMLEARHPDHPNLPFIRRIQLAKLEALRADLLEFLRKQDYKHNREPLGPERDSWMRSIEILVGKAHAFGPDRNLAFTAREGPTEGARPPGPEGAAGEEILRLKDQSAHRQQDAEAVRARWNETTSRLASLTFRLYEVEKDRQALELRLAGTEAEERSWRRIAEGLRAEVPQLKAQLVQGNSHGAECRASAAQQPAPDGKA